MGALCIWLILLSFYAGFYSNVAYVHRDWCKFVNLMRSLWRRALKLKYTKKLVRGLCKKEKSQKVSQLSLCFFIYRDILILRYVYFSFQGMGNIIRPSLMNWRLMLVLGVKIPKSDLLFVFVSILWLSVPMPTWF